MKLGIKYKFIENYSRMYDTIEGKYMNVFFKTGDVIELTKNGINKAHFKVIEGEQEFKDKTFVFDPYNGFFFPVIDTLIEKVNINQELFKELINDIMVIPNYNSIVRFVKKGEQVKSYPSNKVHIAEDYCLIITQNMNVSEYHVSDTAAKDAERMIIKYLNLRFKENFSLVKICPIGSWRNERNLQQMFIKVEFTPLKAD